MLIMSRFIRVEGFPGLWVAEGKRDTTYYYRLKLLDGRWERRIVGKSSENITPKTALLRGAALQADIDKGKEVSRGNDKITFRDAHKNYLKVREAKGSNISRDIERWNNYLKCFADIPLSKLKTSDFQDKLIELRKSGKTDGYLEKIFGQARTYFSWSIKADLWTGKNPIGRDSTFTMPAWRKTAKPTRWFTPAEAENLLTECLRRSMQLYDMSLLALKTGLRAMEIFGLGEMENAIDQVNGILNFKAKSGYREYVYVDRDIIKMLLGYNRKPGELIFQSKQGKRMYKISHSFPRAIEAAGLVSESHKVWFHSWRHTFGSWLAQSGDFTLHEIMQYMRHTDDRMTLHYAKLIPGDRKERLSIIQRRLDSVFNQ